MLARKIIELCTKRIKKETYFSKVNPIEKLHEDRSILITKNDFIQVIKIQGIEYSGLDKSMIEKYFDNRRIFFNALKEKVIITTFSIREKTDFLKIVHSSNKYKDIITKKWQSNFKENYKTYHYVMIVSTSQDSLSDLSAFEKLTEDSQKVKFDNVTTTSSSILTQLKEFEPSLLEGNELLSFFASRINGKN